MTQFQSPLQPPGAAQPGSYAPAVSGPPTRWSAAAISGFILSLLGCTGVGAVLGLILGIIGIFATRGGRRRGMGLAIAAIPISLIMGLMSLGLAVLAIAGVRMSHVATELPAIMGAEAAGPSAAADVLLNLASDEFREEVGPEGVLPWLVHVAKTHGKFVEAVPTTGNPMGSTPEGHLYLSLDGKFVNGRTNIKIVFDAESIWGLPKIIDIEVDGVSPRKSD